MPIYAIDKAAPGINRSAYQRRLESSPLIVREKCVRLEQQLKPTARLSDVFENAASLIAAERGTAAMLVAFDHATLDLEVTSLQGDLGAGDFRSSTPSTLMGIALAERNSVHVPDISGLDQRSILQRVKDSGGREVFGKELKPVDFITDDAIRTEKHYHSLISDILPMDFERERGALLLTPLGLEGSIPMGLGFIYEYRGQCSFSLPEIMEARTISSLFSLKIVERFWAENLADQ